MDLGGSLVNERQNGLERYLRIFEHFLRDSVHEVGVVIGKHPCDVQALTVMLIRFVDPARQTLRKAVDSRDIVNVTPFNKTRDSTPVIYQIFATETLEEIHYSRMRFIRTKDLYRHRAGHVQMQSLRGVDQGHNLFEHMVSHGIDITVCLWQIIHR